jgi:hypothetical protein
MVSVFGVRIPDYQPKTLVRFRKGWWGESERHSKAKKYGHAGFKDTKSGYVPEKARNLAHYGRSHNWNATVVDDLRLGRVELKLLKQGIDNKTGRKSFASIDVSYDGIMNKWVVVQRRMGNPNHTFDYYDTFDKAAKSVETRISAQSLPHIGDDL